MIEVRLGSPPPVLDGPDSPGGQETAKAIRDFANGDTPFTFRIYSHDGVKDALNALFKFKCAYCESYFGGTQPVDVEHFRPKSGFVENGTLVKPGYYWLAADWQNLLPSCIDCNRERRQRLPDGTVLTSGKANQFPIADQARRARKPGEERTEPRLLLHPGRDQTRKHLEFDEEEGMVRPARMSGRPSAKAEASIKVYALLRDGLVRSRKAQQKLIRSQIKQARLNAQRLDDDGPDPLTEEALMEALTQLKDFMAPEAPYAAMARQMIEPVLAELLP